jgi:hypothetical protein
MSIYGIHKDQTDAWTSQAFAVCNITVLPPATLDALLRNEIGGHAWLFKGCDASFPPPPATPAMKAKRPAATQSPLPAKKKKKSSLGTSEKNKRILRDLEAEVAKAIEAHPDRVASFTKPKPEPGPPSTHPDKEFRENENRRIRYAHCKKCLEWNSDYLAHLTGGGAVTCSKDGEGDGGRRKAAR